MTTYTTEAREVSWQQKNFTVIHTTPVLSAEEKQILRRRAEATLYEIFQKYTAKGD